MRSSSFWKSLLIGCVTFFFSSGCSDATGPTTDWGFGIGGRWIGETSSASLEVVFAQVQKSCYSGSFGGTYCEGVASVTGTIRTASGQTSIRGAAYVGEGTDSPVAVYIIAIKPVEQELAGCLLDSYDYWAWPTHGDMSGDLVIFCSSAGVHGNPSSRTETVRLHRT